MKQLFVAILILTFSSCSKFSEDLNELSRNTDFLSVETDLPIINIEVEASAFKNMLDHPDQEIEIEAYFNLYRNNLLKVEKEKVEIEIKGGFSSRYDLKTLGVKFEDKYDNSNRSLINPDKILSHHSLDKIKAIRLRNSGSDFENTMLKDLSVSQLAINAELDIDVTYGEPTLVYVNKIFYGLLNLRTEGNTNGMAGLYGVKKRDITLAKITTHELVKKDGDFERIDNLVLAINDKDLEFLKEEIDLPSFIDYMVFQSYIGNTDWPHNNARFYAIKEGKFRFVLFDLDKVAWLKIEKSPIEIIEDQSRPNILTDLFFVLYSDEDFKDDFWNRFAKLLNSGLISSDQFKTIVDHNSKMIEDEIHFQIDKYNHPGSITEWRIELDKTLQLFKEREQVVQGMIE